jgi:hypothetical protein
VCSSTQELGICAWEDIQAKIDDVDQVTARPGQEPPFLAVKRLARQHKTAVQRRFPAENAKDV